MGKPGLLDAILLLDYRFILVLAVSAMVYYRPSLSSSIVETADGIESPLRSYTITATRTGPFNSIRFANAIVCGLLIWLTAGVLPLLFQSIHWPLIHDAPIMHYVAWRIMNGAAPYRDLYDLNMPGTYAMHIAILWIFGMSDTGWRLFDFLWLALTCLLLYRFCRPAGRWWACAGALFYSAFHLSSGPPGMGQRDCLEFTFLLGGLLLTVTALERDLDRRILLLAGIAYGCAMSIKPMAGMLWVGASVLAALKAREAGKLQWSVSGTVLAGGILAPGLLCGWLLVTGGFNSFLVMLAGVMPLYSKMHDRPFVTYLADYWPILLPCILTVPAALLNGRPDTRRTALILGVVYGVLHYSLQGKGWLYHLSPLMGFASALLASTAGDIFRTQRRDQVLAVAALTTYFILVVGLWDTRLRPAMALTAATSDTVAALTNDLSSRLGPNVTVQPFDTTGGCLHALLRMHVALPTPYIGDYLFFVQTDQPYVRRVQNDFMSMLRRRPPTYLIFYRWGWPSGQYDRLARFPALQDFVRTRYRVDLTRPQYMLYRLQGTSKSRSARYESSQIRPIIGETSRVTEL